ncbi:hypothetical protein [Streptomyces chattanoogensis]|uniref:Uncharacterized protein n=1 Tax=Streptomyces chattanoogensis TaxID=66876 RepID=A0A0N0XUS6_9ACTN|nr:hypothetical protein [Streptomyces chattanoogensis]KPC62664.1 hypothetical protein ADL29_18125 [Streptomyces chattanoogensis]
MGNRADDEGTDVEIYRKPLSDTIHADTPTSAPDKLLALLDSLGLERKTEVTAGPVYVWHEVPSHLSEEEKKQLATRAVPSLLLAGYVVNIPDDLFDPAAYRNAVAQIRNHRAPTPPARPHPAGPATPADSRAAAPARR